MQPQDELLPSWTEKESSGDYMEVGAQLCTRDGRKCGNAFVNGIICHDKLGDIAEVVTDAGSVFNCTPRELAELFYPPKFILIINDARTKFRR